ncbi:hypothetical protein HO173_008110 [Letharia columbiana]|uniref:Hexosyltransferase n=1 Tax=Letharia columbiana TaxID=112416 RepID=A0A8H6L2Z3_9LECA|nr:uncharacterized protein HO173_008110 [Letharia columbiana]KAF6233553.1 hypothetical protein HO173_008110 [Letharia columbiana]
MYDEYQVNAISVLVASHGANISVLGTNIGTKSTFLRVIQVHSHGNGPPPPPPASKYHCTTNPRLGTHLRASTSKSRASMPYFSQRSIYISLSAVVLVFFTALALTPRPSLNTLSIPSPFSRTHNQSPHQALRHRPQRPQQQGPLSHHEEQQQPTWLLATMSAYFSQQRRNVIRATWQTLYPNPAFETCFFIAKPPPLWQSLIKQENDTYGDLIMLDHLEESTKVAMFIKPVEFLKHLLGSGKPSWKFVSKIDDDSFVDAERFYHEFLRPRIDRHAAAADQNGTLIARRLRLEHSDRNFSTPGGQFYTLSWDLVRILVETQARKLITNVPEDVLVGRLLYDADAKFEFVDLDDTRAFDVTDNLTRLSQEREDLGPMDAAAINPHKMKDDETYLRVAELFGKDGFVGHPSGAVE